MDVICFRRVRRESLLVMQFERSLRREMEVCGAFEEETATRRLNDITRVCPTRFPGGAVWLSRALRHLFSKTELGAID